MNATPRNNVILPAPLRKGDTIGLVAPAGPVTAEQLRQGIQLIKEMGLQVAYGNDILRQQAYLAGSDQLRVEELHRLWQNPDLKAILAVRGGYGSGRLLDLLDYELLGKHPKIFLGFSDLTVLLNVVQQRTGLVTFHGPMLSTLVRDGRQNAIALFDQLSRFQLPAIKDRALEILRPGRAAGPLLGGNLTSLIHLLATPHEPDWQGKILFLEDINEPAYRVDRMLSHLKQAGRLGQLAGIILGDFFEPGAPRLSEREQIWTRALELTTEIPVWANFPIGHGPRNQLMPIGTMVEMDSNSGILKFSAPCFA